MCKTADFSFLQRPVLFRLILMLVHVWLMKGYQDKTSLWRGTLVETRLEITALIRHWHYSPCFFHPVMFRPESSFIHFFCLFRLMLSCFLSNHVHIYWCRAAELIAASVCVWQLSCGSHSVVDTARKAVTRKPLTEKYLKLILFKHDSCTNSFSQGSKYCQDRRLISLTGLQK